MDTARAGLWTEVWESILAEVLSEMDGDEPRTAAFPEDREVAGVGGVYT